MQLRKLLVASLLVLALPLGTGCDDKSKGKTSEDANGPRQPYAPNTQKSEKQYKLTFFAKTEDVDLYGTFKGSIFVRRDGLIEHTNEYEGRTIYEYVFNYNESSVGHLQVEMQITLEKSNSKNSLCRIIDSRNQMRTEQKTAGQRNVTCEYTVR